VFGILLVFVLLGLALTVILFAGGTWLQGFIYSEPEEGMIWRAPVAAIILTVIAGIWVLADYRSIKQPNQAAGSYTSLFTFSPDESKQYTEIWGIQGGKKTPYKLEKSATGQPEFCDSANRRMPKRVDAIIVMDDKEEIRFDAEKDEKGSFRTDPGRPMRYVSPNGKVMTEDSPGEVTTTRSGVFLGNVLLALVHFAGWFACLWLIMRFQWHHALGLALVFWLVMSLVIMPMVLSRAEDVARERAKSEAALSPGS
jgi:hypothetical protein